MMEETRYMDMKKLCKYLSMSRATIYRKKDEGTLPYLRFDNGSLRFDKEAIDRWMQEYNPMNELPDLPQFD